MKCLKTQAKRGISRLKSLFSTGYKFGEFEYRFSEILNFLNNSVLKLVRAVKIHVRAEWHFFAELINTLKEAGRDTKSKQVP